MLSSRRKPGSIRRGGCCCDTVVDGFFSTTTSCGYGPPFAGRQYIPVSRSCELKIGSYRLPRRANHWHSSAQPAPPRGTFARSSRNVVRVAMDAAASGGFARRAKRPQRTAKSCGPGAATVASILSGLCWGGNGDNQRRSPGRARISRKPLRGESRCGRLHLWCFARVLRHAGCPCASARGIYGCIRRPAFPAPSAVWRDNEIA